MARRYTSKSFMIATGAKRTATGMPGSLLKNVFTLHNRQDAKDISEAAAPDLKAAVRGAGQSEWGNSGAKTRVSVWQHPHLIWQDHV